MTEPHVRIEIAGYDPRWPVQYEEERRHVAAALGAPIARIEHIGSTSVPGLSAKPIIDLLVTVAHLGPVDPYVDPLGSLGYTYFPILGNAERYTFGKGDPHTHHLHIVQHGGDEHLRPLVFRDYLRTHPDDARRYAALKRELAARFPGDRPAYLQGKTAFVRSIEARARQ